MNAGYYMGIPRGEIPWFPEIRNDACSGCQTCVETCPNGVLGFDEQADRAVVANPLSCVVLCDKCARFCPDEAIVFPDKKEFRNLLIQLGDQWRQRAPSPN